MAKTIVGVMGPGAGAIQIDLETARQLGQCIAEEHWLLLTGGRESGVMDAASKGAHEAGGTVIGILPGSDRSDMSSHVDLPIITGLGSARNNINVLSSDIVIACGVGIGTFSEVLLAAKAEKHVILLNQTEHSQHFLKDFESHLFHFASTPDEAVRMVKELL